VLNPLTALKSRIFNDLNDIAGEASQGDTAKIPAYPGPKWRPYASGIIHKRLGIGS